MPLSQSVTQDTLGSQTIAGEGVAGTPSGGVLSIQGVTNGTKIGILLNDASGNPIASFPDNSLSVTPNPKPVFDDTYATSATLDTANRWNTPISSGGGVVATVPVGGGDVALGTGTTANGYSVLTSQYAFNQLAPGFIELQNAVNLEFPIIANTYRYWGLGTPQTTPSSTNPLQDGMGFEVSTSGKMYAITYSGGTRNIIADLSVSTGNGTQPQNSSVHKYFIFFRGELAFWKIDNTIVASMLTGALGPINNTLPIAFLAIAGSTAPSSSGILTVNGTWVGDTTGSSTTISDGIYKWRTAQVTNNQLATRDVLSVSSQYRAQSVTTTAAQALGGATVLVNRKLISITPTNGTIYWGTTNLVTTITGQPLFPNNTLFLSCTDNSPIWLISAVTTDVRITEFS
jgi:hypothetical protein